MLLEKYWTVFSYEQKWMPSHWYRLEKSLESVRYLTGIRMVSQWLSGRVPLIFWVPYKDVADLSGRQGAHLYVFCETFPVNKLCTHLYSVMYFYFHKNVFADTKRWAPCAPGFFLKLLCLWLNIRIFSCLCVFLSPCPFRVLMAHLLGV